MELELEPAGASDEEGVVGEDKGRTLAARRRFEWNQEIRWGWFFGFFEFLAATLSFCVAPSLNNVNCWRRIFELLAGNLKRALILKMRVVGGEFDI